MAHDQKPLKTMNRSSHSTNNNPHQNEVVSKKREIADTEDESSPTPKRVRENNLKQTNLKLNVNTQDQTDEIQHLNARCRRLRTEKTSLHEELQQAKEDKQKIEEEYQMLKAEVKAVEKSNRAKLSDHEVENKGLHAIIAKFNQEDYLTDHDIATRFEKLVFLVQQFVRNNFPAEHSDKSTFSSKYRQCLREKNLIDLFHLHFFSAGAQRFGFDIDLNDHLGEVWELIHKTEATNKKRMEWRRLTIKMGRLCDDDGAARLKITKGVQQKMWSKIEHYFPQGEEGTAEQMTKAKETLLKLCQRFYDFKFDVAGCLGSYRWDQITTRAINPAHYNIVQDNGYRTFAAAGEDYKIVAGAFLKVRNEKGNLLKPIECISKGEVLLGPCEGSSKAMQHVVVNID